MTGVRRRLVSGLCAVSLALMGLAATEPTAAASSGCGTTSSLGTRLPVLFVHGFNSSAQTWSPRGHRSALAQFCDSRMDSFTFDYGSVSNEWVTDKHIGPALATRIRTLAAASRADHGPGRVYVVAHSMGGLAVRCAEDSTCNARKAGVARDVAGVVTLGTPNRGTFWLSDTGLKLGRAAYGGLLSGLCYAVNKSSGTKPVIVSALTHSLCREIRVIGTSHAARAFAPGSAELAQLPWEPQGVPVTALAGRVSIRTRIFFASPTLGLDGSDQSVGDLVVGETSALAGARRVTTSQGDVQGGRQTIGCGTVRLTVRAGSPVPSLDGTHLTCSHLNETSYPAFLTAAHRAVESWLRDSPTPTTPSPSPRPTPPPPSRSASSFSPGSAFSARCAVAWPTAPEYTSSAVTMRMSCSGVPENTYLFTDVEYDDPSFQVTPSTGQMLVTGRVVGAARSGYGFSTLQVLASSIQK